MTKTDVQPKTFSLQETYQAKGIAVCLLLFHHLFSAEAGGLGQAALDARVCVWIFVFLSGYGLTVSYQKRQKHTASFLFHHIFSLLTPFWFFYLLLCPFVFWPEGIAAAYEGHGAYCILDILGLADLFGTPHLSFSWWYITFAEILIVLMPLLIGLVRKFGAASLPMLFLLLALFGPGYTSYYGGAYSSYLYAALLGILCAESSFFQRISRKHISWYQGILLLLSALLLAHLGSALQETPWQLLAPLFTSLSAFLICLISFVFLNHPWICRPLIRLGMLSYPIFALHGYILGKFRSYILITGKALPSFLTLLLLSVLVAEAIRFLQAKTGYNRLMQHCAKGIESRLSGHSENE